MGVLLVSAAAAGLVSCSDESPWRGSDTEGGINLNFRSDARVMRQTRADDGVSPVVPAASQFAVALEKSDGAYSKKWTSIDAFNRETAFPIGDYSLTASFGDVNNEGFETPCYIGRTGVHVSPGDVTDVNVTATLANAMVSVRYTDDFKSNFPSYSAAVQTEGHEWVVFAQNEDRPAYVAPSEVKLNLTLTNDGGDKVTLQPASFTAVARHHYVVTIGVEGKKENLTLDVQFDEDVVSESVDVPLGDDLFNAPAPSVKAFDVARKSSAGYEIDPSSLIEKYEYVEPEVKPEFHAFAYGGLKSAILTVVSEGYTPAFGGSVELVGADGVTQQQLETEGVDAAGFFRNADKMGVVNLAGFLKNLRAGNYTVQLQVVDAMTRTSEPVKFTAKINPVVMQFSSPQQMEFMGDELLVDMDINCAGNENNIKFQVDGANATVKSVTQINAPAAAPATRADLPYTYRFVIATAPKARLQAAVNTRLGRYAAEVKVESKAPEYTVETDAFARKVVLRISGSSEEQTKTLLNIAKFYNNGTQIATSNISVSNGLVTIAGLQPGANYSALSVKIGEFEKAISEFTTETEVNVTNGTFGDLGPTVSFSGIQVGGKFRVSPVDYHHTSTISYQQPLGWATVNELTCWANSGNKNTWFMVPSTYSNNGAVVIRSVGYNHNGTTPDKSGGAFNTKYYCENAPSDNQLQKAAGELFLGSYSFDGSEHRVDGTPFSSRPTSVSFDYTYVARNNEKAEVYVRLYSIDDTLIAEKVVYLGSTSATKTETLILSGYPFGKKASKIKLCFKSTQSGTVPSVNIPSGSQLNEGQGLGNHTINANSYHALATGSVLTIDNVRLGYEATSSATPNAAPARVSRR